MRNHDHPAFSTRIDPETARLSPGERLARVVDPRLADLWAFLFEAQLTPEETEKHLGWLLRMAYLQGYTDADEEGRRGSLYHSLGLRGPADAPKRNERRRPR